ncbi:MAG: acylneuraminate cytidylyltransferase, partial [Candidatus Marinimicrobia bacterium]|nr:acylneuraminate cytidylyltransferase [Candidatus Neomarinimicrobiota bacterium]
MSASAKNIKLVGTDIDGVWTDARMYYSADGDIMKSFSTYDGMGVKLLREAGIPLIIMTGEDTEIVAKRAQKLGIDRIFQGENEKL